MAKLLTQVAWGGGEHWTEDGNKRRSEDAAWGTQYLVRRAREGCGLKSAPIFVGREGDVGVNMAMTKFALFESEGRSGARGSGGYVGATAVVDFG
uniref:Uncharacterized protein n=1 Tax=Oryza sativa subsp. japonica TaxID=39947 RepID=Q5ZC94_ORYSJ|nr:hypothetical protein [Oryza sativa Japonica Group]BAD88347.1 hypothetical protein [Oryza sativa Japonica Group]